MLQTNQNLITFDQIIQIKPHDIKFMKCNRMLQYFENQ